MAGGGTAGMEGDCGCPVGETEITGGGNAGERGEGGLRRRGSPASAGKDGWGETV